MLSWAATSGSDGTLGPTRRTEHPRRGYGGSGFYTGMRVVDDLETRFVHGEDEALRAAYDAHGALVFTFCRRALGADLAEDVTQEVFVAAWRARARYRPERGALAGWLIGIAKHKVVDALRAQGRRPTIESDDRLADGTLALTSGGSDADVIDRLADSMLMADALRALPDRARTVVQMAFFDQSTHPEIAAATNLPLGTVKSDIRRSLSKLRRHLEHHDA